VNAPYVSPYLVQVLAHVARSHEDPRGGEVRIDESIARHVALALPAAGAVEMEGAPGAIDGDPIAVLQRQGVKLLGGYLITV
jgi:hypothetical protein